MVYSAKIVSKYLTAVCLICHCCEGILHVGAYGHSSIPSKIATESDAFLMRSKRNVVTQTQAGTFQRSISGKEPIITYVRNCIFFFWSW